MMTMAMSWKLIVIALVLITDSNRSLIGSLVISSPFLWNYILTSVFPFLNAQVWAVRVTVPCPSQGRGLVI